MSMRDRSVHLLENIARSHRHAGKPRALEENRKRVHRAFEAGENTDKSDRCAITHEPLVSWLCDAVINGAEISGE